jgi:O-glycosyl hydrolase
VRTVREETMTEPTSKIELEVDTNATLQTIDGFGVNINSKYWGDGQLLPVLKMLVDDLGATLFRLDAYGKANWIDPDGTLGPDALGEARLARVYEDEAFRSGAALGRWLNERGLEPYVTVTGVVPPWMCEKDGITLKRYDLYAQMVASYASWMRRQGVRFSLFGPFNETDIGPPEGPKVAPPELARALVAIVEALDRHGLSDVRLVAAEQAYYNLEYTNAILDTPSVKDRIGAYGFHCYADYSPAGAVERIQSAGSNARAWMTEYGDLDQSGEREWHIAWIIFGRLLGILEGGMTGALNWDAFDNFHDHDGFWTIYGLVRAALKTFTPKKRFYTTRQMYRFVRPGYRRVGLVSDDASARALSFLSPDGETLSVVGRYAGVEPAWVGLRCRALSRDKRNDTWTIVQTTADENAVMQPMRVMNQWGGFDLVAEGVLRPRSVFTITNGG